MKIFRLGFSAVAAFTALCAVSVGQSGETRALSVAPRLANNNSYPTMIDPQGRWLLFASAASNLVPNDTNQRVDLFVYDLTTHTIRLLTSNSQGALANGDTPLGVVAANGTVVIQTSASNLDPSTNDRNNLSDILVGSVQGGSWRYLSVDANGVPRGGSQPYVSPSGRFVAWVETGNILRVYDLQQTSEVFRATGVSNLYGLEESIVLFSKQDSTGVSALHLYDFSENRLLWTHSEPIVSAVLDSNLIAYFPVASSQIFIYDWAREQIVSTYQTQQIPFVLSLRGGSIMYSVHESDGTARIFLREVYPNDPLSPATPVSVDELGEFRKGRIHRRTVYPLHTQSVAAFSFGDLTPPMIAGDINGFADVFVRYFRESVTRGITVGTSSTLPNSISGSVSLSNDARIAVFASRANNLVPNDTNHAWDIFVRSADGRLSRLTSLSGEELNGDSYEPRLSGDGSTVVFVTTATNLGVSSPQGRYKLVRYRLGSPPQIEIIAAADVPFASPRISEDGKRIVFTTEAQLTRDDTNEFTDVYLYDATERTLSLLPHGINLSGPSYEADISADGNWVAFTSEAIELAPRSQNPGVYLYDIRRGIVQPISKSLQVPAAKPSVNRDGSAVAFEAGESISRIYVWRGDSQSLYEASVNSFGLTANLSSRNPSISHDGTRVAFESEATNLTPLDGSPDTDIFVHDLNTGWTYAVVRRDCVPGNAPSFNPVISGDGGYVAFQTTATNLADLPLGANGFAAIHPVGCVPPGDVNRDGSVDDYDLLQILFVFGTDEPSCADLNMDGFVDDADLLIVLINFGLSCHFGGSGNLRQPSGVYDELMGGASKVSIEETEDTIIFRTTAMSPVHIKSLDRQAAEIEMMHRGLWPYPVAGRGSEAWIRAYGDPLTMSSDELQTLIDYLNAPPPHFSGDFTPASGHSYTYSQSRTINLGTNDVNVSLSGSIYFNANCQAGGSVVAEAKGDAVVNFFSISQRVAEAYGKASVENAQASLYGYFKMGGQTLWKLGPRSTNLTWSHTSQCHYGGNASNLGPWTRQWSSQWTLWLGIVPIQIQAGMNIEAGACYLLEAGFAPVRAEARFRPYVNSSAFASGGVQLNAIVCSANAGVSVNLTLVNYVLEAYAKLNLGTQNNRCCVFLNAGIHNTLSALRGRLSVYAEACCWGLSGPRCGWGRKRQRWEHDLFRWSGFTNSGYLWGPWSFTYCFN